METHIFDFDEDLYGRDIEVKLLHYRRPEQKFSSREELKTQMENDIAFGREFFHESGITGEILIILGVLCLAGAYIARSYRHRKEPYKGRAVATVVDIVPDTPDHKGKAAGIHDYYYPVFAYYAEGRLIQKRYYKGGNPCPFRRNQQVRVYYSLKNPELFNWRIPVL